MNLITVKLLYKNKNENVFKLDLHHLVQNGVINYIICNKHPYDHENIYMRWNYFNVEIGRSWNKKLKEPWIEN